MKKITLKVTNMDGSEGEMEICEACLMNIGNGPCDDHDEREGEEE